MNKPRNYQLETLEIDGILERPGSRNESDDLRSLEKSIRELGLLFPVLVNKDNVLIAGFRRLEACRRLGWKSIPVFRMDVEEHSLRALDILIQENLCRRDLNVDELETLIGRKKDFLGRLRRRAPWRKLLRLIRPGPQPSRDTAATR